MTRVFEELVRQQFVKERDEEMELNEYLKLGTTTLSNSLWLYYQRLGMTDGEFLVYLQLFYFQQKGELFPAPEEIAFNTGKSLPEIYQLIDALQEKKFIQLETLENENHMKYDQYDLTPFFEAVTTYREKTQITQQKQLEQEKIRQVYQTFEGEFSRSLSPFELETINQWLNDDQYQPEVILLALKEAVLNQAYSLKYIDRILLSWEKKNIRTKEQVEKEQARRNDEIKTNTRKENLEEIPDIPFAPWLEEKK